MSLPNDKQARKERPMFSGLLKYFPDALAEVAHVSYVGNQQHNPGQPLHWAREKSTDHLDCVERHLTDHASGAPMDTDKCYHLAKAAWRILAELQLFKEAESPKQPYINLLRQPVPQDSAWQPDVDPPITCGLDYEYQEALRLQADTKAAAAKLKRVVYISGRMRHMPNKNYAAFDKAKMILQEQGYTVISPADMDRQDATELTQREYARRDTEALDRCTHIAVLPDWENSEGGQAEFFYAKWIGLKVIDAYTGKPLDPGSINGHAIGQRVNKYLEGGQ